MKNVVVKQSAETPLPAEVIAEAIVAIAEGVRKLRAGRLNDRALVLLIQNAAPSVGDRHRAQRLSARDVKAVLDGIDGLEREYLKPKKAGP